MSSFLYKKIWHGISIHTRKCIPFIYITNLVKALRKGLIDAMMDLCK